jgi:dipeptidyl aminopeptidase/acylaminoacyl peptidase
MSCFCRCAAGLGLAWMAAAAGAAPSPADIPLRDFFAVAEMNAPLLSPDGKHIAMIVPGDQGRAALAVARTESPEKRVGVARISNADIFDLRWINDRRILFTVADRDSTDYQPWMSGMYAVDLDGSNYVGPVGQGSLWGERSMAWNLQLGRLLRDGSDDIVVLRSNRGGTSHDWGTWTPMRVDTRKPSVPRVLLWDEPRHAVSWALDGKGVPVAAYSVLPSGESVVWWRPDPSVPWQEIDRYNGFRSDRRGISPTAVLPDGRLLVRSSRDDAARTAAIFAYDPRTRQREAQPLIAVDGFDAGSNLIFDRSSGQLVGGAYTSDAHGVAWLDPRLRAIQQRVDRLLPGLTAHFTCDPCGGQRHFVVSAWSDRQPVVYFLFDSEADDTKALRLIGGARPKADPRLMAEQDFHRVPSRDGRSIPVYVTRPHGKGPWPAVVLVHGGPHVRGTSWGWDAQAQFLASRGYLVVEPEFRGSTGFGRAWEQAGWKQWGLAMQDDVTDATRWAIAQKLADPARVAIAGASYGGYSAMMGLVREPELYRAGINWVGVTDIGLLYTRSESDMMGSLWLRDTFPWQVADPDRDAEQMRRTSPLLRAAEIRAPVLMAYGREDFRVPLVHGERMRDALKAAGKVEVEWVVYDDEGHGFRIEANRLDFWKRVEAFLARHLKKQPPGATSAPSGSPHPAGSPRR